MRRILISAVLFGFLACSAGAVVIQDWSQVESDKNVGVFKDDNGSKLNLAQVAGPVEGENALQITASLVQWGGVWTAVEANLLKAGALRFSAKASEPGMLQVGLTDDKKTQVVAMARVLSSDWEEFVIPLSKFEPTKYPMPDAPKNAPLRKSKIVGLQFQPQTQGTTTFWIGPVSTAPAGTASRTGLADVKASRVVAQDFSLLGKNAYGPFADKEGSTIGLTIERDPEGKGARLGSFKYDMKKCGWCGYWMRAGDVWGGQDWRGAKALSFKVYTTEPLEFQFSFNDANQNSYTAKGPKTKGGWETLSIPFSKFGLDEYYQPPEAKEGAPQDLSKIETFNLSPKTQGKHEFKIREIVILK